MGSRSHRDIIFGDVDAQAQAFFVDIGEVFLCFFRVFVGHVQINMVVSAILHLVVDGTRYNVTRSKRKTRVIFLHEFLAVHGAENTAIAAHCFRNQERRAVARMIEGGRMELYEFHIFHRTFGTVNHGDTVSGSHQRIGGGLVDGSYSSHQSHFGKVSIYFSGLRVEDISAVTFDIRCLAGNGHSQMMLCQDFNGKLVFDYRDVRMPLHGFNQAVLYFRSRVIFVVKDTEFRVSPFAMQVKFTLFVFVEVYSPLYQFFDLCRSFTHHFLHCGTVANPVAGVHGVFNVLVEIVYHQVGHRRYPALREVRIGFFQPAFTDKSNFTFVRHFQRKTHAGNSGADNEEIEFSYHNFVISHRKATK